MEQVVSIDTETSGWDLKSPNTRLTQIAAISCSNLDHFSKYVKQSPEILEAMQPDVIGLTGITVEKLISEGVDPSIALEELLLFTEKHTVVAAHNWNFDKEILRKEFEALGIDSPFASMDFIDTLRLAREAYDEGWEGWGGSKLPDFKLSTCYYGIIPKSMWTNGNAHEALYDATMVAELVYHFSNHLGLSVADMVAISKTPFEPRVCPIGKDRGQKGLPWNEVDSGFLSWMVKNAVWGEDIGLEIATLTEMQRRGLI